jgi:phospholipid/cholesterol/gamma-HCH transport system permease protein
MAASLALEGEAGQWRLRLSGDWSLGSLEQIEADLTSLPDSLEGILECDWSGARSPGIGPSWALLVRVASIGAERLTVRHTGPPQHLEFLEKLRQNPANGAGAPAPRAGVLGRLGRWALEQGGEVPEAVAFFGRIVTVIGEGFSRPRALRISSLTRHVYETGVTAIPIVASIAFLISVIGADIFVVDLVAIAVLREMGVLLTAIIVAGRSGSAFAAEIGAMRLNEETDALRAMGMNPIEMLVVPRVLALAIALPLLTILADAMGLAGGGLLSMLKLHISWPQFMNRAREALAPTTFWAGLIKAPVFAVLIGMVGTYRGMQVRESARELGRLTTVAVVQSIFLVILADAFFAVLFVQLDF